jgi:hypothetical protein
MKPESVFKHYPINEAQRCQSILERTEDLFAWIKQQVSNQ